VRVRRLDACNASDQGVPGARSIANTVCYTKLALVTWRRSGSGSIIRAADS
jgi:hypothetical protein